MKIETTINMNKSIMKKLDLLSEELKKSRTYIIRLLLGKMLEDERSPNRYWVPNKISKEGST